MAYHFKHGESIPDGVSRIVREELESAAGGLSRARRDERDEAIHEARKSLKKARAVLRLMRPELEKTYRVENPRLRNIALQLSELRDAAVMIETLDGVEQKYRQELGARSLVPIRRALARRKRQGEQQAGIAVLLGSIAAKLRAAARRAKRWALHADGFEAISPGFEMAFRRGRKAFALARKHPSTENDHTWRKRVKDHWYHVRLLDNLSDSWLEGYERELKQLETALGDGHNLSLLREKVLADPSAYGNSGNTALLIGLVERYEKELRDNAVALSEKIYGQKPRLLVREFGHLWTAWKSAPDPARSAPDTQTERAQAQAGGSAGPEV